MKICRKLSYLGPTLLCLLHFDLAMAEDDRGSISSTGASSFNQALARGYGALADVEQQAGDHRDAWTYHMRGQAAEAGRPTAPDDLEARRPYLKSKYTEELGSARQRLVQGLSGVAPERVPVATARAQTSFDCWVEQAAEDLQPDDIAACKQAFELAMNEVDEASRTVAQTEPPAPPPEPTPPPAAPPPAQSKFLVFFDFDKATVTNAAEEVLENFRSEVARNGSGRILAIGHADTSGSDSYNIGLSQRRADAVRKALQRMNVPTEQIETQARGESEPLVATGDGVREPQNRRVELSTE